VTAGLSMSWCDATTPRRVREIPPARAGALRKQRPRVVRVLAPGQVRTRSAGLLALLSLPAAAPRLRSRRGLPGQVIGRRRHPRVPRVPRHGPLKSRQPLRKVRDLRRQLGIPLLQDLDQQALKLSHHGEITIRRGPGHGSHRPRRQHAPARKPPTAAKA
jgi:hypothetical protein